MNSPARSRAIADRRRTILYATLGVIAIALIALVGYYSRPQAIPTASVAPTYAGLKAGAVAPEFALSTTAGPFDLATSHDEPVLLEVFATWCPHCQREVVTLNQIFAANKATIHLVAVNGSANASETDASILESQANVYAFAQRFGVTYPVAYDQDLGVANKYLEGGFPTIVLIGRDGRVQASHSGEASADALQKAVAASVAGRPVDPTFGLRDPG